MKKILAGSICLVLCLMCFAGCGKKTLEGTYYMVSGVYKDEADKKALCLEVGTEFITFREDGTLQSALESTKDAGGTYTLDDKGNVNLTLKYGGDYMFTGKIGEDFNVKDYLKKKPKYKGKEVKWLALKKQLNEPVKKLPIKDTYKAFIFDENTYVLIEDEDR